MNKQINLFGTTARLLFFPPTRFTASGKVSSYIYINERRVCIHDVQYNEQSLDIK